MERRTFLSWVGVGFLASSLPVAIAACSPSEQTDQAEGPPKIDDVPRDDGFSAVGTVTDLDTNGFVSSKVNATSIFVIGSSEKPDDVVAFDALCTHQGCSVDWSPR